MPRTGSFVCISGPFGIFPLPSHYMAIVLGTEASNTIVPLGLCRNLLKTATSHHRGVCTCRLFLCELVGLID